ncbi:MAG: exonuclease SbcCD subunit D [Treponema sp.]|jgi:exonuclease SbcD|nr:exonuclease SbcCD subunit D [Treponema sp.]
MIKFLHTADLHLGKVLHEQSLIEDQRHMLEGLADILTDESYQALIIAGDVYDRSIPSIEAVELFGSFLGNIKARRPSLEILVIPGNHDSPARLGFGREIFAGLGLRFVTDPGESGRPLILKDPENGKSCAFFLLPFLSPASFRQGPAGEPEEAAPGKGGEEAPASGSRTGSVAEAAGRLEEARLRCKAEGVSRFVLAAHLFASGGREAGSERIFLGSAELADMELFAGFDYVALGHLHRMQQAGKNGWYSGSPLAYSFGEAGSEKYFLSVELDTAAAGLPPNLKPLPVSPLRKLRRLSGPFERFFRFPPGDTELSAAAEDYLEINLSDRGLTENALAILRKNFPRLLAIRQDAALSGLLAGQAGPGNPAEKTGERRDTAEDFREFLTGLYGEADEGELALFRELLGELEGEEQEP